MKGYELLKFKAFSIVACGTIKCAVPDCNVRSLPVLHLDHIHNDGHRHRAKHSKAGGVHCYQWAVKHPEARKRLQILCAGRDRAKQRLGSIEAIVEAEYRYDNESEEQTI
jgi:hypothetical protein